MRDYSGISKSVGPQQFEQHQEKGADVPQSKAGASQSCCGRCGQGQKEGLSPLHAITFTISVLALMVALMAYYGIH